MTSKPTASIRPARDDSRITAVVNTRVDRRHRAVLVTCTTADRNIVSVAASASGALALGAALLHAHAAVARAAAAPVLVPAGFRWDRLPSGADVLIVEGMDGAEVRIAAHPAFAAALAGALAEIAAEAEVSVH